MPGSTHDARLADFSVARQATQMAQLRRFRAELIALQPTASATAHERVDYLLILLESRSRLVGPHRAARNATQPEYLRG